MICVMLRDRMAVAIAKLRRCSSICVVGRILKCALRACLAPKPSTTFRLWVPETLGEGLWILPQPPPRQPYSLNQPRDLLSNYMLVPHAEIPQLHYRGVPRLAHKLNIACSLRSDLPGLQPAATEPVNYETGISSSPPPTGDTSNARDTWRITESLTNTNSNIFKPLTVNGKTVTEIQEKVNAFADTLEQVFTTDLDADRTSTVSTEQVVSDFFEQPLRGRMRTANPSKNCMDCQPPQTTQSSWAWRDTGYNTSTSAEASSQIYCQSI
jgi:hypothetical protein